MIITQSCTWTSFWEQNLYLRFTSIANWSDFHVGKFQPRSLPDICWLYSLVKRPRRKKSNMWKMDIVQFYGSCKAGGIDAI